MHRLIDCCVLTYWMNGWGDDNAYLIGLTPRTFQHINN